MTSILLIGLAAGVASALLFATVSSGSAFAVVLFYAAPLPILIAGLGWRHLAGLVGALVAAAGLAAALDSVFLVAFFAGVGAPAWLLAYLALLARPTPGGGDGLEWYPIGRLVFWAAIAAAIGVGVGVFGLGTTAEDYTKALRAAVEQVLRAQTGKPAGQALTLPGVTDPEMVVRLLVSVLPPTAAVLSMMTALLNLWGAARVVRASGRLVRPWPDLAAIRLPIFAAPAFAAAALFSVFGGLIGVVASLFAATLSVAYGLVGLAVVHDVTRRTTARGFILASLYVSILVFGWPLLIATAIGFVDGFLDFRRRASGRRGPPAANDQ